MSQAGEEDLATGTRGGHEKVESDCPTTSSSKFKFKSRKRALDQSDESPRSTRTSNRKQEGDRRSHKHHKHRRRSRTRRRSPSSKRGDEASKTTPEEFNPPYEPANQYMSSELAFRESLFDAMADDEGALFWEGVYGQPIHTYPDVKQGPSGELERMTDEEYTAFVRAKMYEKTHQHLLEEKARKEAAKKEQARQAEEEAQARRADQQFRREMEDSLRRGAERRSKRAWLEKWETYVQKWDRLGKVEPAKVAIASIPWPVESGKRRDVTSKAVENFFLYASSGGQPTEAQLSSVLKLERVRWHPDKIQQKLGGQDVGEDIIQGVTEVFQVIDKLWSTVRGGQEA